MDKHEEKLLDDMGIMIRRDNLIEMLREGERTVTFTKKDGTTRVMQCTLNPDLMPAPDPLKESKPKKVNNSVLAVWDLEAKGFRSFLVANVKDIC